MKFEFANLALWFIAFVATLFLSDIKVSYLGPVYAICMIGSTLIIRRAIDSEREK